MCTVVLLVRPGHRWPLLLAANRDERVDRAADPPGRWWPDQPDVTGGRDGTAGGTWLAVRRDGFVAAVLNRAGSLGPAEGFASRGEIPLRALRQAAPALAAADALAQSRHYRPFNLVLADRTGAWFVRGGLNPASLAMPSGLHMVTAGDPDDPSCPRVARHLPALRRAVPPDPPDWSGWHCIMAGRSGPHAVQMNVDAEAGFGTVSSSRVAVPDHGAPRLLHAAGPPDRALFIA
jgi:uncharacterized protein with NRDE domain